MVLRLQASAIFVAAFCCLGFGAIPARAADPLEVSRVVPAAATGLLDIELFDGSITIEAWERDEVEVEARLHRQGDQLDIDRTGNTIDIEIESKYPGHSRADLKIKAPRGSSLRIEVLSAAVDVAGLDGELDIEAVNGSIEVAGGPRKLRAHTVNGSIDVAAQGSRRLELETVSGSLAVDADAAEIDASTVAGSMRLHLRGVTNGKFETVSGSLDIELQPGPRGRFDFESFSGSITLAVPADISGRFELESTSGRLLSQLGARREGKGRLAVEQGSGEASFRLESFNGAIELKALPAKP